MSAVAAQMMQAFGSFLLQVIAARELGADGFGVFALLFGSMIMATAVTSGLVGDSLTVLDRFDPAVRSALRLLAIVTIATAAIIVPAVGLVLGGLGIRTCLVLSAATGAYMLADVFRRLLMANMRFWHLVLVDFTALVTSMAVLGTSLWWELEPGVGLFLLALAVGQVSATAVAALCLPHVERMPIPWRSNATLSVVRFGAWRAAQQFVRPTMLNAARWIVLVAAGHAAVGQLEAARVYVAPAMLVVQGVGSYLISSYAADRKDPTVRLLRRADTAAVVMLTAALGLCAVAVVSAPLVAPLVTGGAYVLSPIAVIGWGVYAASCAAVMPYGSLAAVRGQQSRVFLLRVVDSAASLGLLGLVVLGAGASTPWAPMLLSAGSFFGGAVCRQLILRPIVRLEKTPDEEERDVSVVFAESAVDARGKRHTYQTRIRRGLQRR